MMDLGGLYRGVVEDVNDPEERKRYRVRVMNVHREEIATNVLPWAELCAFGGKGFGDIPSFEVGDIVLVMFMGGDRRFPFVMGGWLSYAGGTSDLPSEQTGEYERTQRRWVRYDRNGNKIVMDEEAQTIEVTSGKASVLVNGIDGSIVLRTDGVLEVHSPRVSVIEATQVDVQAEVVFAEVADEVTLNCEGVVNIRGGTEVNVGEYQQDGVPPPPPTTTPVVNIKAAQTVNVESAQDTNVSVGTTLTLVAQGDILIDGEANLTIDGKVNVRVLSEGECNVEAQKITLESTGTTIELTAATDVTIDVGNNATVAIQGQATVSVDGALSIDVLGNATIDVTGACSIDAQSTVDIHAAGVASLKSDSVVDIEAPVINVTAQNTLNLESEGVARLDGTTVLIAS